MPEELAPRISDHSFDMEHGDLLQDWPSRTWQSDNAVTTYSIEENLFLSEQCPNFCPPCSSTLEPLFRIHDQWCTTAPASTCGDYRQRKRKLDLITSSLSSQIPLGLLPFLPHTRGRWVLNLSLDISIEGKWGAMQFAFGQNRFFADCTARQCVGLSDTFDIFCHLGSNSSIYFQFPIHLCVILRSPTSITAALGTIAPPRSATAGCVSASAASMFTVTHSTQYR